MKGEMQPEPRHFTAGEWINKKEISLSGWPINKKANHAGRLQAGNQNRAKGLIRRLEAEGKL